MSGGAFQYLQSVFITISEDIQERLDRQGKPIPKKDLILKEEYYQKYPEDTFYESFSPEVQQRFKEAIYHLKKAYIYAKRIDWFLSGDDGEESFLERLEEELEELEREL